MNNNDKEGWRFTRRRFVAVAAGFGSAGFVAGLAGNRKLFATTVANAHEVYKVVPDWPREKYPRVQSRGIDIDARGMIYVAGNADHPVLIVRSNGTFVGSWGKGLLVAPHGLRIHEGSVWVTDIETQMAHQFTRGGKLLRSFGEKDIAGDGPEQFNRPTDFAFGPDGAIYISDGYRNTRVVCRNPDGTIRTIWGEKGDGPGQFDLVHAIAIDKVGNVYVADRNNDRVQIFDLEGKFLSQWEHVGKPYGLFSCDNGTLFLCGLDPKSNRFRVMHLNRSGKVLAQFGETGDGPGQFLMAHSLCVSKNKEVIVADGTANRIQKFTI